MENIISYEKIVWVASIQFLTLLILTILIVKRKIGRPLTESELKERRDRLEQKKIRQERIKKARLREQQDEQQRMAQQDANILALARPVRFVSLSGDGYEGRTICVQDGNGEPHTFHLLDPFLSKFPVFNSLYSACKQPHYYGKRGEVIFQ